MMTNTTAPSWAETITDRDGSARTSTHTTARSGRIEVLTGPERRRRWSIEQKRAIVAESYHPGTSPAAVARKHDLSTGQLYTWRRQLAARSAPAFARVALARETAPVRPPDLIEIVLPDGIIVRTGENTLRRVLAVLRG